MSEPRYTLPDLADIVCDDKRSVQARRMAVQIAYNQGVLDAMDAAAASPELKSCARQIALSVMQQGVRR